MDRIQHNGFFTIPSIVSESLAFVLIRELCNILNIVHICFSKILLLS